jgi:hypothetical protein
MMPPSLDQARAALAAQPFSRLLGAPPGLGRAADRLSAIAQGTIARTTS